VADTDMETATVSNTKSQFSSLNIDKQVSRIKYMWANVEVFCFWMWHRKWCLLAVYCADRNVPLTVMQDCCFLVSISYK